MCFAVFAATLIAYWPSFNGSLLWDDAGHLTHPQLQSWSGLLRIWFEPGATQQYYPLLHSAFWLEHHIWGDATLGYHLINVLLHATSACLFATILRRLAVRSAWLAAFLFALHPVTVESVAWIAEQKNTLSTAFYLAAVLAFLRFESTRTTRHYVLATLLFVLALLTKTVTATLPAALLVLLWWRRGKLDWRRDVTPLVPWFALGIAAGLATAWFERTHIGAQGTDFALGPIERALLAGRALWFYFTKALFPVDLIFIYPRWTIDASAAWQWLFPLAALGVVAVLWWRRRRNPGLLATALLFGGTLFPALGFVNVFPFLYSYVADHFQYVAMLAIIAAIAAGVSSVLERQPRWAMPMFSVIVCLTLGALTWAQAGNYRDVITLYTATLEKNPACWMAHNNLAIALVDQERAPDAISHYEKALALRANYAEGENNLGYALIQLGRPAEAETHLRRALQIQPQYADAYNNLGTALMGLGKPSEGIASFAEAVRLQPKLAVAHFNQGLALASTGKPAEGIPFFQRALQLDSNYADAELNWAIALTITERIPEALPHFDRALRLNPASANAHVSYGRALAALGRLDEAIARFRAALELQPNLAEAHFQLAIALRQSGRLEEAEQHLRSAQQLGRR